LSRLASLLPQAVGGDTRPGKAVLVRGSKGVGKSRLVKEFVVRAGVPHVFYAATEGSMAEQLARFTRAVAASTLPGAALFSGVTLNSWDAALRLLASAIPQAAPSVVVLDELLHLIDSDPPFEGTLQKLWDRELSRRPVLLIGIGSDVTRMAALNGYDRPYYQRATEMVVNG